MARTTTTRKPAGRAAAADAKPSATDSKVVTRAGNAVAAGVFDPKAAKAATRAERAARAAGKEVATTEHTVLPGKSVRSGGVEYTEGDTVHLSAADSERLILKRVVAKGQEGAEAVAESTDTQAAADAEAERVAQAQREADEAAAKAKDEAAVAAGKLSGAENR